MLLSRRLPLFMTTGLTGMTGWFDRFCCCWLLLRSGICSWRGGHLSWRDERLIGGFRPESHVLSFLWKASTCDILNHEHKIGCKATSLLRVHRDALYHFQHKNPSY
jgi:hypothetical protein